MPYYDLAITVSHTTWVTVKADTKEAARKIAEQIPFEIPPDQEGWSEWEINFDEKHDEELKEDYVQKLVREEGHRVYTSSDVEEKTE